MTPAIIAVALALGGAGAPVSPADRAISCARLSEYSNAWMWTVTFPNGRILKEGIWTDNLDHTTVEGRTLLRRVQGMTYANGKFTSTINTVDPVNCAPVRTEQRRVDESFLVRTFNGARVDTSRRTPTQAAVTTSFTAPRPPFDFYNGEEALILASLPLRVGFEATIQGVDELSNPDGLKTAHVKVLRREWVNAGGRGRMKAYVIVLDLPGEYTNTYWIADAPPYFIRFTVDYPDHRYRFSFDMI